MQRNAHRVQGQACTVPPDLPDEASRVFASIGILSHDSNRKLRDAVRASWLSPKAQQLARSDGVVAHFVLRANSERQEAAQEAAKNRDVVIVPASSSLGRKRGPLKSLLLWWKCSLHAWPSASLIGKADDDVYLNLRGIAAHGRAAISAVRAAAGGAEPRILWGAMESYQWNERTHRPVDHRQDTNGVHCQASNEAGHHQERWHPSQPFSRRLSNGSTLHGPFPFARGPLYMLSTALVAELLGSERMHAEWDATLQSAADERRRERVLPYEDVFTGWALSKIIAPQRGLALVENGFGNGAESPVYSDGWGLALRSSTLIYHMRTKQPSRLAFAHRWLETEKRECRPGLSPRGPLQEPLHKGPLQRGQSQGPQGQRSSSTLDDAVTQHWVRCGWHTRRAGTVSCTGALWRRCTTNRSAYRDAGCNESLIELKREARDAERRASNRQQDSWQ